MRSLTLLTILGLALSAPAFAGNLYTNGPTNGTNDAYFIDVYQVSDQFTPSGSAMGGFDIAEWIPAGATPLTFDWSIGSTSFGNDLGFGVAHIGGGNATATLLCSNGGTINGGPCGGGFGYDVYQIDVTAAATVGAGDWLTLTGATDNFGGRDAWDINSGPSAAFHNLLGAVPSESFTLTGCGVGKNGPDCGPPIPEPGSIMLFGSGILGLAGILRRRRNL